MASRKMWFCVMTSLLVILAAKVLPSAAVDGAVMGLVSVAAIYVGGNTASKWVLGRVPATKAAPAPKPAQ